MRLGRRVLLMSEEQQLLTSLSERVVVDLHCYSLHHYWLAACSLERAPLAHRTGRSQLIALRSSLH